MPDAPTKSHKTPATPKPRKVAAARASASKALDTTGRTVRDLAERAAAGIEANPLATLVGGIALGAIAGAFVPRTEQEERLLAPIGQKLSDTAYDAIDAAKGAAISEFDFLGLTRDAARGQMTKVLESVVGAVSSAGVAALTAGKAKAPVAAQEALIENVEPAE